jgi:hypothetical protein
VVEAIESSNGAFAVGVQWHPELLLQSMPLQLGSTAGWSRVRATRALSRRAAPCAAASPCGYARGPRALLLVRGLEPARARRPVLLVASSARRCGDAAVRALAVSLVGRR